MSDLIEKQGAEEVLDGLISEDREEVNLKKIIRLRVSNTDQAIAIGAEISQRMAECRMLDKNNDDEEVVKLLNTLTKLRALIEERFRDLF